VPEEAEMTDKRPPTPPDVRRILREESAFGCCRCGYAFFQDHHIVEWSEEHHFRPEDMAPLCSRCHELAGTRAISAEEVRACKAAPFNEKQGFANGLLWAPKQTGVTTGTGPQALSFRGIHVKVDGETLLHIQERQEQLWISGVFRDRFDRVRAELRWNFWTVAPEEVWDWEAVPRWIRLRSAARKIELEIDARKEQLRVRAKLWKNGRLFELGDGGVQWGAGGIQGIGLGGGLVVEVPSSSLGKPPFTNEPCPCESRLEFVRCHGTANASAEDDKPKGAES
jgi:hypothetical protein